MLNRYSRTPELQVELAERIKVLSTSGKSKLVVFDFDGTLVDSPLPEYGKPLWLEVTGNEWPHKGWWGRKESLDLGVFDIPTLDSVIKEYEKYSKQDDTIVIMLTGRMNKLHNEVRAVLNMYNLEFDLYMLNTGGETGDNKMKQIEWLMEEIPSIEEILAFDDRDEHIPRFDEWGQSLVSDNRLSKFNIIHVLGEHHGETP